MGGKGVGKTAGGNTIFGAIDFFFADGFLTGSVFLKVLAGFFWLAFLTADRNCLCAFFASLLALRAAFLASLNVRLAAFNLVLASFACALVVSKRPSASRTATLAAETSGELFGEPVDFGE